MQIHTYALSRIYYTGLLHCMTEYVSKNATGDRFLVSQNLSSAHKKTTCLLCPAELHTLSDLWPARWRSWHLAEAFYVAGRLMFAVSVIPLSPHPPSLKTPVFPQAQTPFLCLLCIPLRIYHWKVHFPYIVPQSKYNRSIYNTSAITDLT